jgi:hypothetical protein
MSSRMRSKDVLEPPTDIEIFVGAVFSLQYFSKVQQDTHSGDCKYLKGVRLKREEQGIHLNFSRSSLRRPLTP